MQGTVLQMLQNTVLEKVMLKEWFVYAFSREQEKCRWAGFPTKHVPK